MGLHHIPRRRSHCLPACRASGTRLSESGSVRRGSMISSHIGGPSPPAEPQLLRGAKEIVVEAGFAVLPRVDKLGSFARLRMLQRLARPVLLAIPAIGLAVGLAARLLGFEQSSGLIWAASAAPVLLV